MPGVSSLNPHPHKTQLNFNVTSSNVIDNNRMSVNGFNIGQNAHNKYQSSYSKKEPVKVFSQRDSKDDSREHNFILSSSKEANSTHNMNRNGRGNIFNDTTTSEVI